MSDLRSGGHGREYPELQPEARDRIIERFHDVARPYFGGFMGFKLVDVAQGYSRMQVENRQELSNPSGVMHGGASFGLADSAVATALMSIYGIGKLLLTIEMKINYLEPIPQGTVTAEAYVLRSSRRSAYAEVDIWAAGKLAARANTTYMIRDSIP